MNGQTLSEKGFVEVAPGKWRKPDDPRTLQDPKPKRAIRDEPLAEKEGEAPRPHRLAVRVTRRGRRLLDSDNICAKGLIDGLRYAGLIPDDTPEDIALEVRQEKAAEESAVIEITAL